MRPTLACLATLALAAAPAAAQVNPPASPPGGQVSREATCHASDAFLVIGRDLLEDVGTEFLARRKATPAEAQPCVYDPKAGDLRIGGSDPLHFEQLVGRFLVLTNSTGPAATLVIHDLLARSQVLEEQLTEASEVKREGNRLSFTIRVGPGNAKSCKQWARYKKDGGTGELGAPSTFDLTTGTLVKSPNPVCTYAQ